MTTVSVGRAISRIDGQVKVTGAARYPAGPQIINGLAYGVPVVTAE